MKRHSLSVIMLALSLSWMASAQDAKSVLDDAMKAMGVQNIGSVRFTGSGMNYAFGQAPNPTSPWPKFNVKSYDRIIDFDGGGANQKMVRTQGEDPPRGGGLQPIVGEQTQNQTVAFRQPWADQADIWVTPVAFLKGAAMAKDATVKSETMGGKKYNVVSYTVQDKYKLNGYINEQNEVEKVDTWIDTPVLGDTLVEGVFSDYKDFRGLKFPTKMTISEGGYPILDLNVATATRNVISNVVIPPSSASSSDSARVIVDEQLVAPGVYYFTGGTHHSVIVEFNTYVAVIEGPLDEARSTAVISEVKKLFFGKPIKYLINTHQHFDHLGGVRTYVDEGATIVTYQMNKPYMEKTFALPRTLNPDKLAKSKKKAVIEVVGEKRVITDGTRTLELYHITNSGHNDGMLMAYLPKDKILVEADLFTPPPANPLGEVVAAPAAAGKEAAAPPPVSPYILSLVDNLDRLKLDYDMILPLHGHITSKADLMKAARKDMPATSAKK